MDKLVSIIVPVYNTKDYLQKSINSICNQTYQNLEIIIVDDGSTDGSAEICDRIQEQDRRISVIHKENRGIVSARKTGVERASGDYILTVDSDDWLEDNMIGDLLQIAEDNCADVVTSGYYRESDRTYEIIVDNVNEGIYKNTDDKEYLYHNMIFCGTSDQTGIQAHIWCKLIKSSLMKKAYIDISEEINFAEDAAIIYSVCTQAETIVVTYNIYYHYFIRAGSTVYKTDPYYFRNLNELYLYLKKVFKKSIYKEILMYQLDLFIMKLIFWGSSYYFGLNREVTIPYYDFDKTIIENNSKVILYSAGRVGQAYYKQICAEKTYQLVGWIDKNYSYYQDIGIKVLPIEAIKDLEYDYIILAFRRQNMAESVKKELIEKYEIQPNKLIWLEPVSIIDKYCLV